MDIEGLNRSLRKTIGGFGGVAIEEAKKAARPLNPAFIKSEVFVISHLISGAADDAQVGKMEVVGSISAALSRIAKLVGSFGPGYKTAAKHIERGVEAIIDAADREAGQ